MSIVEIMNKNILNRFESKDNGTIGFCRFKITLNSGVSMTMLSQDCRDLDSAMKIANDKFGCNVKAVEEF